MSRQFDNVLLGSIELFCLAAEVGSFTGAAMEAGITPAAVSRSVSRLEARMGVRLFVRTTRRIRLTDVGRAYFDECREALSRLINAERLASGQQSAAAGLLRISMPTPYAHYRVLPLLPEFRERYPQVQIDAHISNQNIDFSNESYDLAIRGRAPMDSNLIARKLEDAELVIVAAPDYLARRGIPRSLDDLKDHECIQFERPSTGRRNAWAFMQDGQSVERMTRGDYSTGGDVLGGVTLARSGAGLFQTYHFVVENDLRDGKLVQVLPQLGGATRPFVLMYPHGRHLSLRVRCFVDFLVEKAAGLSPISRALR